MLSHVGNYFVHKRLQMDFGGLGAGDYRLDLIVYDRASGERYAPASETYPLQSDDRLELFTMTLFD